MLTRISAEFESIDIAELASKRIKQSVSGIHRIGAIHNKSSIKAEKLAHGLHYTILPAAVTTHNYFTAVLESETSESEMEEPYRSSKTIINIICDEQSSNNVMSLLNAMGALQIKSSQN